MSDQGEEGPPGGGQGGSPTAMLPPSPNWYCAQILDCSVEGGMVAVGCKEQVVLLDTGRNAETASIGASQAAILTPRYAGFLVQHTDRVTTVAFCPRREQAHHLASGSADHSVVLWDVSLQSAISSQKSHDGEVVAVCWSPFNLDLVFSVDKGGTIISWTPSTQSVKVIGRKTGHASCMACSPAHRDWLAVGYKKGTATIYSIETGAVLHRLHGHQDEVQSVHWQPMSSLQQRSWRTGVVVDEKTEFPGTSGPESDSSDGLLATGARDRTIRVWDPRTGRCTKILDLPRAGNMAAQKKERVWVSVLWSTVEKHTLFSSSNNGDILAWSLRGAKPTSRKMIGQHFHSRPVFGLATVDASAQLLVSVSMDRQIIFWDGFAQSSITTMHTLGGYAYCAATTDLDPYRVAVGVGDGTIRVWTAFADGSGMNQQVGGKKKKTAENDCILLWKGLQAKMTAVCWHPEQQGLLAYGTEEGQVGTYDVYSQRCTAMRTYHRGTVYSLGWKKVPAQAETDVATEAATSASMSLMPPATTNETEIPESKTPSVKGFDEAPGAPVAEPNGANGIEIPRNGDVTDAATETERRSSVAVGDATMEEAENTEKQRVPKPKPKKTFYAFLPSENLVVGPSRSTHYLWSIGGDGIIYQHDPQHSDSPSVDPLQASTQNTDTQPTKKVMKRSEFAWRTDESYLAVGNGDGSVEIYRPPTYTRCSHVAHHTKLINRLAWQHPHAETIISGSSWWLASASDDGVVCVYTVDPESGEATLTQSLRGHTHRVTDISWVPLLPSRLASSSFDHSVQVWDVVSGQPLANYRGHIGRVFTVRSSYLDPDVFVSGSEDQTVRVWRASQQQNTTPPDGPRKQKKQNPKPKHEATAETEQPTATTPIQSEVVDKTNGSNAQNVPVTKAQSDSLAAAMAAFLAEEEISRPIETKASVSTNGATETTGKESAIMEQAKQPNQTHGFSSNEEKTAVGAEQVAINGKSDKILPEIAPGGSTSITARAEDTVTAGGQAPNQAGLETVPKSEPGGEASHPAPVQETKEKVRKEKKYKSLLQLIPSSETALMGQHTCTHIAATKNGTKSITPPETLQVSKDASLFAGSRRDVLSLIREEEQAHGNSTPCAQLRLWEGDILGAVMCAIEGRCLSDYHVAMAAAAGPDVWRHTCLAYARQLEENGDTHKAVSYYLALGNAHAAITVYLKAKAFRDALALARLRLLPGDPIIPEILFSWASESESRATFEQAAKCFIAVGDIESALTALRRKKTPEALAAAAEVATSCTHPSAQSYCADAGRALHLAGDYKRARAYFMHAGDGMQGALAINAVGESLSDATQWQTVSDVPRFDWTADGAQFLLQTNPWARHLVHKWQQDWLGTEGDAHMAVALLERETGTIPSLVARALLLLLLGRKHEMLRLILEALSQAYSQPNQSIFRTLSFALLGTHQNLAEVLPTDETPDCQDEINRLRDFTFAASLSSAADPIDKGGPEEGSTQPPIGLDDASRWRGLLKDGWAKITCLEAEEKILQEQEQIVTVKTRLLNRVGVVGGLDFPPLEATNKNSDSMKIPIEEWMPVHGDSLEKVRSRLDWVRSSLDEIRKRKNLPFPSPVRTGRLLVSVGSRPGAAHVRSILAEMVTWCIQTSPTKENATRLKIGLSEWPQEISAP